MIRTTSRKLHASGLSPQAKTVLDAAVRYAEKSKQIRFHSMLIADFCSFSGLDVDTSARQVINLMAQVRRAVCSLKVVDTTGSSKKEVITGSCPVFVSILVTKTHVSFEVCRYMWDEIDVRSEVYCQ